MIETYLAMLSRDDQAVEEGDRTIILQALFRPTATGFVKEDPGPTIGLPGVLK